VGRYYLRPVWLEPFVIPVCRRTNQHVDDRLDEAALAAGFRERDERAVRDVVRRYGGTMTAIARSLIADRHRADDAVQQAFLQAWRAAHTVDSSRALGPWLHTITRRVCIDMYRRERRAAIPASDAVGHLDEPCEPAPSELLDLRWEVRRVLDKLPPKERVVVKLQHQDGLSHDEIAAMLQVPIGTVKSRSWRAHRRLADMLADSRPYLAAAASL
jgi:RNA polymerase sigma-70 factor (ECF subfamily)